MTPGLSQKDLSGLSACQNMGPCTSTSVAGQVFVELCTSTSERDQGKEREHEGDQEVSLGFENAILQNWAKPKDCYLFLANSEHLCNDQSEKETFFTFLDSKQIKQLLAV